MLRMRKNGSIFSVCASSEISESLFDLLHTGFRYIEAIERYFGDLRTFSVDFFSSDKLKVRHISFPFYLIFWLRKCDMRFVPCVDNFRKFWSWYATIRCYSYSVLANGPVRLMEAPGGEVCPVRLHLFCRRLSLGAWVLGLRMPGFIELAVGMSKTDIGCRVIM